MLKSFGLSLLMGCSMVGGAGTDVPVVDFCELDRTPRPEEVTIFAVVETDNHHGMFIGSDKCSSKLRIGTGSVIPEKSVERFMSHVNDGQYLTWRKYSGQFSGHITSRDGSEVRFELSRVHWFRDEK